MMQKKQYEAIAAAINSAGDTHVTVTTTTYELGREMFAKAIRRIYAVEVVNALEQVSGDPTFDRDRFLKACGVEE